MRRCRIRRAACSHALCESEAQSIRALGLIGADRRIPNGAALPTACRRRALAGERSCPRTLASCCISAGLHRRRGRPPHPGVGQQPGAGVGDIALVSRLRRIRPRSLLCAELKALAAGLGVGETVHFAGPLYGPDKAAAFASSDAFILPSFSEGMPNAALEAWAHGLPSLLTRSATCRKAEYGAAIAIEPSEARHREWAPAADRHDRRRAPGDGGRGCALVSKRFSWQVVAAELEAVYRWLLGLQERPETVDLA